MLIDLTNKTKKDIVELFDSMAIDSYNVEVNIGDEVTKYSFLSELNGQRVDYVLLDDILIGSAFTLALWKASQTATNDKWDNRLYLKIDTETDDVLKLFWDTSMPKDKRDELFLNAMRSVDVFPFEEQEHEYGIVRTPVSLYHFCHDQGMIDELGKYHREYVSLFDDKKDTEEKLMEAEELIKNHSDTIKSLEDKISELENLISDLQYEKQELEERNEQLSDEIGELAPSGKRFRR